MALLILGFVGFKYFGKRRRAPDENLSQLSDVSTTSPNSVFGTAVGQTIDTGGTSLLHTDFSQTGVGQIDADEGVDPVAEADVYMAYGRDAQAEEILLDALKSDPSRNAIYIKLLEIYAQRGSVKQFENVAADLHVRTGGIGEDWAKAVALGMKIDPSNPLFHPAQADASAESAIDLSAELAEDVPVAPPAPPAPAPVAQAAAPVSFGTSNVSQVRSTWTVPGDINQLTTTGGSGDVPVMVELPQAAVGTTSLTDSLNLDFNLDLDTPEADDLPTQIEPRSASTPMPTLPPVEAAPKKAPAPQPATIAPMIEDIPLEFDIGLDEGATGGTAPSTTNDGFINSLAANKPAVVVPPATAPRAPNNFQDELDVGIESAHKSGLSEVDLEKTNFEGSLLDFDFELGDEIEKPTLDLSAVNLRTAPAPASAAPAPVVSPVASPVPKHQEQPATMIPSAPAGLPDIGDSIDVDDEVATKLELARAYEEMGDVEGARELLEEVISDGSGTQKEEARAMIQRLGA